MPFTDATDNAISALTDAGRDLYKRASLGTICFQLYGWAIGRGGYQDANPVKVDPIDTTLTDLIDRVYPSAPPLLDLELINEDLLEYPNNRAVSIICRVPRQDINARHGYGELGIWVKVLKSEIPTTERSRASNVSTITTLHEHSFTSGQTVNVVGMDDGSYDSSGSTVTVVGPNSFTYVNPGPDEALTPDTSGVVQNNEELDQIFLYSVSHFPLFSKIDDEAAVFRPIVQM